MKPDSLRLPRPSILLPALALFAILPFAGSLGGWFIYDDFLLIPQSDAVRESRLTQLWTQEFFQGQHGPQVRYFRPLVTTSFAVDWAIYGGNASGFHVTNLLLHAIATVLAYRTLVRWSGRELLALLATLLWAWHPSKVEAVSWISGRTDVLCTLGLLIATSGAARRFRGLRHGLPLEIIGAFIAFSSKESAIVLPGLIAVEAWVAQGRPAFTSSTLSSTALRSLPHAALCIVYLIGRSLFLPLKDEGLLTPPVRDAVLLAVQTWGEMLHVIAFPWPLATYRAPIELDPFGQILHEPLRLALGAVAFVGLFVAIGFLVKRRRRLAAVGLALTGFLLVPTANIQPTGMPFLFSERFLYLPLLGLALAFVELAPRVWGHRAKLLFALASLALVASATASWAHTAHYEDEDVFWQNELAVQPNHIVSIGSVLKRALESEQWEEALDLSIRGYQNQGRWLSRTYDVAFTLAAAKAYEGMASVDDGATQTMLLDFYRRFFIQKTESPLVIGDRVLVIDGRSPQSRRMRDEAPGSFGKFQADAALTLARAGECDDALPLARDARELVDNLAGLRATALTLARCNAFDEALELTARLGDHSKARPGIEAEIESLRAN